MLVSSSSIKHQFSGLEMFYLSSGDLFPQTWWLKIFVFPMEGFDTIQVDEFTQKILWLVLNWRVSICSIFCVRLGRKAMESVSWKFAHLKSKCFKKKKAGLKAGEFGRVWLYYAVIILLNWPFHTFCWKDFCWCDFFLLFFPFLKSIQKCELQV